MTDRHVDVECEKCGSYMYSLPAKVDDWPSKKEMDRPENKYCSSCLRLYRRKIENKIISYK